MKRHLQEGFFWLRYRCKEKETFVDSSIWLIWKGIKMSVCVGSLFPCVITEGFSLYCLFCKHRLWSTMNHSALYCLYSFSSLKLKQLTLVELASHRGNPCSVCCDSMNIFPDTLPWNLIHVTSLWQAHGQKAPGFARMMPFWGRQFRNHCDLKVMSRVVVLVFVCSKQVLGYNSNQ